MYDDVLFTLSKLNGPVQLEPPAAQWLVGYNQNVIGSAPGSGTWVFFEFLQVITGKTQLYAKIDISDKKTKKRKEKKNQLNTYLYSASSM